MRSDLMIRRLAVVGFLAALPLMIGGQPGLAQDYKQYCVAATTPAGPQPPLVCVVDPTPAAKS
jgi:hypothetical protein